MLRLSLKPLILTILSPMSPRLWSVYLRRTVLVILRRVDHSSTPGDYHVVLVIQESSRNWICICDNQWMITGISSTRSEVVLCNFSITHSIFGNPFAHYPFTLLFGYHLFKISEPSVSTNQTKNWTILERKLCRLCEDQVYFSPKLR